MENFGKWKLIKTGFWLGVGFMIPQLVVLYSGTALTMLAMPAMLGTAYEDEDIEDMISSYDLTEHINRKGSVPESRKFIFSNNHPNGTWM